MVHVLSLVKSYFHDFAFLYCLNIFFMSILLLFAYFITSVTYDKYGLAKSASVLWNYTFSNLLNFSLTCRSAAPACNVTYILRGWVQTAVIVQMTEIPISVELP